MLIKSKKYYRRNLLISMIISELLIISAFIFAPRLSSPERHILYNEPLIPFDKIPRTIQSLPIQNQSPEIPSIQISDEVEVFELLDDVRIGLMESDQHNKHTSEYTYSSKTRLMSSVPRLIFEVVPARDNDFNGILKLSLKINENGEVIDHRILYNSLDCTTCLNEIIQAAYRSKWEPAIVNGKKEDYWVMKSYSFN